MHDRDNALTALFEPLQADLDAREVPRAGYGSGVRRAPFPLWLTMEQLLEVAEDAEIRAGMLRLRGGARTTSSDSVNRTVDLLQEVAVDLRVLAGRLDEKPGSGS